MVGRFQEGKIEFDSKTHLLGHSFDSLHFDLGEGKWGAAIDLKKNPFLPGAWKIAVEGRADLTCKGTANWNESGSVEFEGKLGGRSEFSLSNFKVDLARIEIPYLEEGLIEGQGHVVYDGRLEADFDFSVPQNQGMVHLHYDEEKKASFCKIDYHGAFDCTVDHVETDFTTWHLHDAHISIPGKWIGWEDISVIGDLTIESDLSKASCLFKDAFVSTTHLQDIRGTLEENRFKADFVYEGHPMQIEGVLKPVPSGILVLGAEKQPMTVEWEYGDQLLIHSIEGSFLGIDASFREVEPNDLIGSATIDFRNRFNLGSGFALKGKLQIQDKNPHFTGLVVGKDFQWFGHEFKTLISHIDVKQDRCELTQFNISDGAGRVQMDHLLFENNTLSIPELSIHDFRPSFLKKVGKKLDEINPFVVREFKLHDLKGDVNDLNSFTAFGDLRFINSFRRDSTIFDAPADLFTRIFGLDLELLIPVRGTLDYTLQDGLFTISALKDSFSENSRSEFFLANQPATIDMAGNVRASIQMKQFVLFKFTEAFLITIDGKIYDPQFNLQRKKWFFGL
jgi:hypothetical protein